MEHPRYATQYPMLLLCCMTLCTLLLLATSFPPRRATFFVSVAAVKVTLCILQQQLCRDR